MKPGIIHTAFLAFIISMSGYLFAACVTPGQEAGRYANPAVVYYSIDASMNSIAIGTGAGAGATPQTQIAQAFTAWNNANVGVTFKPATSGHPGTLIVTRY